MAYDWRRLDRIDRLRESRTLRIAGWIDLAFVFIGSAIMLVTHSTKLLVAVIFTAIMGVAYLAIAGRSGRRK